MNEFMGKLRRIKHEIAGVLAISLAIVTLLSLFTHKQWDTSPFTYKVTGVNNLLGISGSYLSDILLQGLGLTSYLIPIFLCIYGIRKILGKEKRHRTLVTLSAFLILTLSISSLLTLLFRESSGGILGFMATRLSIQFLSVTGSLFLFVPLLLVTLMLLTPFSIVDFIRGAKKARISSIPMPFSTTGKEPPQIKMEEAPPTTPSLPVYKQEALPLAFPAEPKPRAARKITGAYELPNIDLLKDPSPSRSRPTKEDLLLSSSLLEKKLQDFSIEGRVTQVNPGPVITQFEFEPAPGIKINKVVSLADDLALTLKATSLRIATIPGSSTLGIEVPNKDRDEVLLKEIISSESFRKGSSKLSLALGKDISGNSIVVDLGKMPHLLIAGATGAGKSVGINTMVLSLLYRASPKDVKLIMIDPKRLELPVYEGIPHLMHPIITSPKEAAETLRKVVLEMERRYRLLAEKGSRNIDAYNKKIKATPTDEAEPIPYLVIFIDELADLMLVSAHEVENSIARLAQMARAAGIHLILATQRPSVDVITGVIKANFSSRVSFRVASKLDSRIILDTYGAEQLLGKGDMLFVSPGMKMIRIHGAYVSEEEVKRVVDFIKTQGAPDYTTFEELVPEQPDEPDLAEKDELYEQARDLVLSTGQASISYVQRRLKIGYNRAARIIEMMQEEGLIGPPGEAGKPREILRKNR
ncbi:MAG: DNA translocase FtsK 4TM domain-containing protein [Nitrospirae bacterium]|nr:DNA translocase FtsK 4TM domain-containing protein [Nitrospirota bacterium]